MSSLQPKHRKIILGDKEYGMLFSLNAIDAVQEHFDIPISELEELMSDERRVFAAIRTIITILINEAIDDAENGEAHVTEAFVGRKITASNMASMRGSVFSTFTDGVPEVNEEENPMKSEQ